MVNRLYDENLYRFDSPQESYWEATSGDVEVLAPALSGDEICDVAIIGGGYTGLSAALHLARDYDVDVRVLEAGHIGWGASGRNGGFCTMGGTGYDTAPPQVQALLGPALEVERLKDDHKLLSKELGIEAHLFNADECRERFFDSSEQHGALQSRPTFGLHPLRYCRGLANAAVRRGAQLHEHSEVLVWEKSDDGLHRLTTAGGTLAARKVIFSTNGFMPEGLRAEFYARTLPVISAIVVTRPLTQDEKAAHCWVTEHPAINSRRILNYFRVLPDDRFMFGGRGHSTGHPEGEAETYQGLAKMLKTIWPEWSAVEIDYGWHGLICTTGTLYPAMGQLEDDDSVYFGYGYHGNGVNTATWTGKQLATWLATGSALQVPEIVKGLSRRFPLAKLRLKYLRAAIAMSSWLDRLG